jgi:diketogulonate reductase-like aldo/keto reductase
MPLIGLGTAFGWDASSKAEAYNATRTWLANGGRAIHAAWMLVPISQNVLLQSLTKDLL